MDTLVHNPFFVETPAFFGLELDELLAAKSPDAWPAFERGELDEQALARRYFRDGRSFDLAGLRARMSEAYRFLPGIEALLGELLAAGVEMHALSNYPVWWRLIEAKLELSRFMQWSFVSCDTGVRKPDPEAFTHAARALGREPGALVFVDDQARNCAAAQAVGMRAIHFEDARSLGAQLRAQQML